MEKLAKLPAPVSSPENEGFWDAAGQGKLLIKSCRSCGESHHYPRTICPFCHSADTAWKESKGRGVIHTYSVMRRESPVTIPAYVSLDEGILMMTNIVNCDPAAVRIGMRVTVSFAETDDGTSVPVFQPA